MIKPNMQCWTSLLRLAVAALLLGLGGCDPGPIVWRGDGAAAPRREAPP